MGRKLLQAHNRSLSFQVAPWPHTMYLGTARSRWLRIVCWITRVLAIQNTPWDRLLRLPYPTCISLRNRVCYLFRALHMRFKPELLTSYYSIVVIVVILGKLVNDKGTKRACSTSSTPLVGLQLFDTMVRTFPCSWHLTHFAR